MIGSMSLRTPLAVLAATACVTGVALAVSDQARSVVDMAPVGVWFANDDADSVSHVGPAGTDATVEIERPDGTLRITELDGVAYVTDAAGRLSRIDPAQLVVSQETTLPSSNTQLIGGGGRLYVVDHVAGTVRELDPEGLTTIGETTKIAEQLGAAVVDDDGVLWIPDLVSGSVVAVDGRTVTTTAQVARPGEQVQLSVVNGTVVAINAAASTVTEIVDGAARTTHSVTVAPGATAPAVVGAGSVLPVVSGSDLVTLDLRNGRTLSIELTQAGHRLGTPALAGDRVYVPDFTAGTLLVVELSTRRVVDTLRVTGRAGTFELVVDGGRVFVNDPASERAWTINASGVLVPVAKYDPSRPGGGSGGGVVPPPPAPTTTLPDERDDRKDDDEEDSDDDEDGADTPPSTTPSRVPDAPTTTRAPAPPVVVVPPSKAPSTPPVVTVPGNGGQGTGGAPPATAPTTTVTPTTTRPVSNGGVRDVVVIVGDESATVSWQPPANWRPVTGYRVVVEPSGGAYDVSAGETEFTASGLRNGTEYVFAITARSAEGDGETVRSVGARPAAPRPDAPTDVVAAAGDASMTVSWEPPRRGRVTSYVVDAVLPDGSTALSSGPVPPDQRRITLTGLTNGVKYYAAVRAIAGDQTSAPTSSSIVTPVSVPGRPGAVSASNSANGRVTVSWSPAPDNGAPLTGYRVSAPNVPPQDVPPDVLSAVFDGLAIGSSHVFTVVATNRLGAGAPATSGSVVVQSQVPGQPGGVTATAGDGMVAVSWTAAPDNGSRIDVYRITNVNDGTSVTVTASERSRTFTSLVNGTSYAFDVQAVATNGSVGAPARTPAVTPLGPLTPPTNVAATAVSPTSLAVTFDAPATVNGNAIASWIVSTTPATTQQTVTAGSATLTGLQQDAAYVVNVVAVTASGVQGPAGSSPSVVVACCVPATPTGFRATTRNLGLVNFVWDPVPDAESYTITPLGGGNTASITVTVTNASYDPQAYYEESWEVLIVANSRYGNSAPASTWVTMPMEPPINECGGRTGRICP